VAEAGFFKRLTVCRNANPQVQISDCPTRNNGAVWSGLISHVPDTASLAVRGPCERGLKRLSTVSILSSAGWSRGRFIPEFAGVGTPYTVSAVMHVLLRPPRPRMPSHQSEIQSGRSSSLTRLDAVILAVDHRSL
jgi:hypothetical protein